MGGDTIAIIWFPAEDKWDAQYPWGRGRHEEIVTDMANKVRRKMARLSKVQWEEGSLSLVKRW